MVANASAADVQSALESLVGFGRATVTRSVATPQGGFTWRITFASRPGPQPIIVASNYLTGVNTTITVAKVVNGSALQGHFFLYSPSLPLAGLCGLSLDGRTIVTSTDHILAGTLSRGDQISVNGSNGSYYTVQEDIRYALDGTTYSVYPRAHVPHSSGSIKMGSCWYRKRSRSIGYNATASQLKYALDSKEGFGTVDVSRSGPNDVLGFRWLVTYSSRGGKLDLAVPSFRGLTGVSPHVDVAQIFEGTMRNDVQQIRLSAGAKVFDLQYGWEGTAETFTNETSALELKTHLDKIRDVGCVSVTKKADLSTGELSWNITFLTQRGKIKDGLHVSPSSTTSVSDVHASGTLQGAFELRFREHTTNPIAANASAEDVKVAIDALSINVEVFVTRDESRSSVDGRFVWSITFLSPIGDVPLLSVGAGGLSGIAVSFRFVTLQSGLECEKGDITYSSLSRT